MALSAYLPRKKGTYVILFSIIILGGVFVFSLKTGSSLSGKKNLLLESVNVSSTGGDSDHDGLKDWEEVLWKTDSHNPDTDGDGALDGEEANEGRDPTKPGPNDAMTLPDLSQGSAGDDRTVTDKLSQRFFAEYLTLKQKGMLDDGSKTQIVEEFINNIPGKDGAKDVFTLSNLKIINDNSASSYKRYGNIMGLLMKDMAKSGSSEEELDIFSRAVQTNDEAMLKKLEPAKQTFAKMAGALSLMEVPSEVAQNHLALINALAGVAHSISAMQEVSKDPALGLGGLNAYQYETEVVTGSFKAIGDSIKNKGVVYATKEAGSLVLDLGSF